MRPTRIAAAAVIYSMLWLLAGWLTEAQPPQAARTGSLYNTAKQKILQGKALVGGTVSSPDANIYCAMASAGFDYLWIEMQHSPLTYSDVAKMIWSCRDTPATPMIRVPDATEGDIQKATDIGALGIIVPTVDTVRRRRRSNGRSIRRSAAAARAPASTARSMGRTTARPRTTTWSSWS